MLDWDKFVSILKVSFRPADPVRDMEELLTNLTMKENQKIAKYNVEFNCLAALCHWGDAPLHHTYYCGLLT